MLSNPTQPKNQMCSVLVHRLKIDQNCAINYHERSNKMTLGNEVLREAQVASVQSPVGCTIWQFVGDALVRPTVHQLVFAFAED